jgi:plasmid stability protein
MNGDAGSRDNHTVSLSVRVPADLRRRLRVYAAEHGVSVQECVRDALSTWLQDHEASKDREGSGATR